MSSSKPVILLIDDNADTLDLIELFLYRDFEIKTAENGFSGLKLAREKLPALIITDIMMPLMDGIKLFNDLRKLESTAKIPIIAMTSFMKRITKKSLLNMGFNGVIAKPIERDKLLALIRRVLAAATATTAAGRMTDETAS
jgi:CheY-like chemotaxis protein